MTSFFIQIKLDTFIAKVIADNLRAAREASGHSKQTIAECVGLSPSSYSQLESRKNAPSLAAIIKLADALHVSIDDPVFEKSMFQKALPY